MPDLTAGAERLAAGWRQKVEDGAYHRQRCECLTKPCIDPFYLTWKARKRSLDLIRQHTPHIVDTRNAFKGLPSDNVVKA